MLRKSAIYLSQKLISQLIEMLKCKLLSQTFTYLEWELSIKYLGGNQIETFTLMYTHIHTETNTYMQTHTNTHTHTHTHTYLKICCMVFSYPANISTSDQRCFRVEITLSDIENETKSDFGFLTLHNVDTTSVPDVEKTLKQRYTTSKQRCTTLVQG